MGKHCETKEEDKMWKHVGTEGEGGRTNGDATLKNTKNAKKRLFYKMQNMEYERKEGNLRKKHVKIKENNKHKHRKHGKHQDIDKTQHKETHLM